MGNAIITDVKEIIEDEECPKCGGKEFTIQYINEYSVDIENETTDEIENVVPIVSCDKCGETFIEK